MGSKMQGIGEFWIDEQMSSNIPPWISCLIVWDSLHSLFGKVLNEPYASSCIGVRVIENLQIGYEVLECGNVVSLDASTINVLIETLNARVWERSLGFEKGGRNQVFPWHFGDISANGMKVY